MNVMTFCLMNDKTRRRILVLVCQPINLQGIKNIIAQVVLHFFDRIL